MRSVVWAPSLGKLVEPGAEQLDGLGEEPGQGGLLATLGMGLEEGVRGLTQLTQAVAQGQESGRLLQGSLGYGSGEAVSEPGQEDAVALR